MNGSEHAIVFSDQSQEKFLAYLSNDGKLDAGEWRQIFEDIYGVSYFTDEFYLDVVISKGDSDGDGLLSIIEMSTNDLDFEEIDSPSFCTAPAPEVRSGYFTGLYGKLASVLPPVKPVAEYRQQRYVRNSAMTILSLFLFIQRYRANAKFCPLTCSEPLFLILKLD